MQGFEETHAAREPQFGHHWYIISQKCDDTTPFKEDQNLLDDGALPSYDEATETIAPIYPKLTEQEHRIVDDLLLLEQPVTTSKWW